MSNDTASRRCVAHDAPATTTCPRCGDFACAACMRQPLAGPMCVRCEERTGGVFWPEGRTLQVHSLVVASLLRLPRLVVPVIMLGLCLAPLQLAAGHTLKLMARSGGSLAPGAIPIDELMMLGFVQLGFMAVMFFVWPFLSPALVSYVVDVTLGRPKRGLLKEALRLYAPAFGLELLALVGVFALICPFSMVVAGMALGGMLGPMQGLQAGQPPPLGAALLINAMSIAIIYPVLAGYWLALTSLSVESLGVFATINRVGNFARNQLGALTGLLAFQLLLGLPLSLAGQVNQALILKVPDLAEVISVAMGFVGGAFMVVWSSVFVALYVARQDSRA